jgi:hypothetical protein
MGEGSSVWIFVRLRSLPGYGRFNTFRAVGTHGKPEHPSFVPTPATGSAALQRCTTWQRTRYGSEVIIAICAPLTEHSTKKRRRASACSGLCVGRGRSRLDGGSPPRSCPCARRGRGRNVVHSRSTSGIARPHRARSTNPHGWTGRLIVTNLKGSKGLVRAWSRRPVRCRGVVLHPLPDPPQPAPPTLSG